MISKDEHKGRDKQKYAEFTAFALAGKCVILSSQQKYRESADVMKQLWDYRDDLRDNKMNKLVQEAVNVNLQNLGPATGKDWEKWLKAHLKPAS